MYPTNQKKQHRSLFRAAESPKERRITSSDCFQQQANDDLCSSSSKSAFANVCLQSSNDSLPSLTITSSSQKITSEVAANVSGSTEAIKGMNADTDQVKQLMSLNATPELFQELKERDEHAAEELAVRDPNFQRQALHDTGDEEFAQKVRVRITGGAS
ncbi:MAG: hypothetical protein JST44_26585 [Cyanobacteria bacterium SZAS LIN-5]|nr:hypothetical protein [Cyanobacteria bacterium SZAS LIN-5]